jgi:hypothetical protein
VSILATKTKEMAVRNPKKTNTKEPIMTEIAEKMGKRPIVKVMNIRLGRID